MFFILWSQFSCAFVVLILSIYLFIFFFFVFIGLTCLDISFVRSLLRADEIYTKVDFHTSTEQHKNHITCVEMDSSWSRMVVGFSDGSISLLRIHVTMESFGRFDGIVNLSAADASWLLVFDM